MTERSILFSNDMMKAIRKGIKVQTRRLVQPDMVGVAPSLCPYGLPGDFLYTREHWRTLAKYDHLSPQDIIDMVAPHYRPLQVGIMYSDETTIGWPPNGTPGRWRPSIHMPALFSRCLLEITETRQEKLQSITIKDARKEGIPWTTRGTDPILEYALLWDSLHPVVGNWVSNPWVWVVSFTLKENQLMDQEVEEMTHSKRLDELSPH